jgi:tRNA1Val (adenine37-N6)-methyltransferase
MKVCTDACIFGAWIAETIANGRLQATKCLDIGTGTGLLSLMVAQQSSAKIDAIEIDKNAFTQAAENFENSPWSERLAAIHMDAKKYFEETKYDLIISNPPFYENDLRSPLKIKNVAKHDDSLTLDELLAIIKTNLNSNGNFALLLPFHRVDYLESIASENDFFLKEKLLIKHASNHDHTRTILLFSANKIEMPAVRQFTIKKEDGNYSDEFFQLLSGYYLD